MSGRCADESCLVRHELVQVRLGDGSRWAYGARGKLILGLDHDIHGLPLSGVELVDGNAGGGAYA